MRNRIFSLLLAVCLATCLFITAHASTVSASVTLVGKTLTVSAYDKPAYFANSKTPNANNWNAKLVWSKDDEVPTLFLKGFSVDDPEQTGIFIPAGQPMRIVITKSSQINANYGIVYKSDLDILQDNDAKLTIKGLSGAITSDTATGCKLTIDANLDLSVKAYLDASSHILQTNKADLTINGGNIKISTEDKSSLFGIVTRNSGNIIINGGSLKVTSSIGAAPSNGSIQAADKIIINGGTVKATAKSSVPLYAGKGIEINDGLVDITGPYYGINAGTPDAPADISIKGGTVKIAANRAFFTYPLLGEGVFAYAGADEASAEVYDGSLTALAKEPWMLISSDPKLQKETEPTEVPTEAPTEDPTEAPTEAPTEVPTEAPTQLPTAAPTEAPTQAPGEVADLLTAPRLLLCLAFAGAISLVGIIITLIAFRRKK